MSNYLYNLKYDNKDLDIIYNFPKSKSNNGNAFLKEGELISGVIKSVGQKNIINILGRELPIQGSLLEGSQVGEIKTFKVIKVTKKQIELRVLNNSLKGSKDTEGSIAVMKLDQDKDLYMSRKSYNDKKTSQNEELHKGKSLIEDILTKLTEKDITEIEKQGISIEKYTLEELSIAINREKRNINEEEGLSGQDSTQSKEKIDEEDIEEMLRKENLPVTKETMDKVIIALSLYQSSEKLNKKSIHNLIRLNQPPTIENIYKVGYISKRETEDNINLTESDWEELKQQVIKTLEDSDMEVTDDNIDRAKLLIEEGIPVSKENLTYYKELEEIAESSLDEEAVLKHIIRGMKEGIDPKDTVLSDNKDYEKLVDDIKSIKDETVIRAVETDEELSIKRLIEVQKQQQEKLEIEEEAKVAKAVEAQSIRALRQMEEIRLKMTADAAIRLEKKGIHIDYEPLEKIVEELRELEENYYKEILEESEVETTSENVRVLKETTETVEHLKNAPSFILGRTLHNRQTQTITTLSKEGDLLLREINRADDAYEKLMTVPSSEYGDSIVKAFKNLEPILNEMDLPDTTANQRALRILGYNSMDITNENINEVKAYDLEVNTLIKNLHPSTTVRMIREGINPLDIPISELNQLIDGMQKQMGPGEVEKFSVFLHRLDKQGQISPEERKSYIGIYRLLYSIEKSDGAALGSVIKAKNEVTLSHLLTAVRTLNKGSLDVQINDDFGGLEELNYKGESITDQIETGYTGETDYLSQALKIMYEELTPEMLDKWEAIKDIPVDQVFDKFMQHHRDRNFEDISSEKLAQMQEILKNSDQALLFLNNAKMPSSTVNIALASQMLSSDTNLYKKLSRLQDEEIEEKLENTLKEIEDSTDKVFDRKTLQKAYINMEEEITQTLDDKVLTGELDAKRLAEIKNIQLQLPFVGELAEREHYQIPIYTEEGIWNIDLTIVREKEKAGRVSITTETQALGNIRMELYLKDNRLKGYIGSNSRRGLDLLQSNMDQLYKAMEEGQIEPGKLDFSLIESNGLSSFYNRETEGSTQSLQSNVTEKQLYLVAQGLIKTIRQFGHRDVAEQKNT